MKLHYKKLETEARIGEYANPTDAGIDLYSLESKTLEPLERYAFKTGIALTPPKDHVVLIKDRSSIAFKKGLHCLAGVIDEGYTGEYMVLMVNLSNKPQTIERGDKFAQILVVPISRPQILEVNNLESSQRGEGGFGSTGEK